LTPLEQIINSSPATRYTVAFLATLTAPFIEEFIFRGILYSALQRLLGSVIAVIIVVALFTVVHIPQYRTNYGVIAAIGLLSLSLTLIRAVSGRLLPCYIVHLVFNGIQSVIILIERPSTHPVITPDHATALILTFVRSIESLI
jgi:membrane protease YdiL (CAAX protease family)